MQTRAAAAAAHQALLGRASTRLGVPATQLRVEKGVVTGGGKSVTYGELIGGKLFHVEMPGRYGMERTRGGINGTSGVGLPPGAPGTKPVAKYTLVGARPGPPRVDIPAKITGAYTYVHNIRVPGMLHGRIVRPRGQGAYGDGTDPQVLSVDASSVKHIPGARVLRKGNFVGVVAPHEYDAVRAAAELEVKWAPMPPLPGVGNLWAAMRKQDSAGRAPAAIRVSTGNVEKALASAAHKVTQTYKYHYNAHVPIGPSCAVADVTPAGTRLFSNSQNIYGTRSSIAAILGVPANKVRVTYYEGSSVYGGAPYNDAAEAAAVLSQLAGAPVRVQFMRWDEHGWDNYGPAQMMDVTGGVDAAGNLVATDSTIFGIPYYTTIPTEAMTGLKTQVFGTTGSFDTTNTGTQYRLTNRRVIGKSLPLRDNYFKVTYLRAPNAPQTTFAYEQLIDELAHAAKMDPYEFRLKNVATLASDEANGLQGLTWDRWKNVLTRVGQLAHWEPKVAASRLGSGNLVRGRGIALGSFAETMVGIVADIEVNKKSGKIRPLHFYAAQDTGLTVYPGGIANQAVGSLTQGASRALFEEVSFNRKQALIHDWVSYPIMRFQDSPKITFDFVQRTDIPASSDGKPAGNGRTAPSGTVAGGVLATGSGEPPTSCIGAAIANAFFDATGVRIREAPMTPARVRAVLKAAGAA
jgi:CO/xanthine dehydrogenase Mo-binding subunit